MKSPLQCQVTNPTCVSKFRLLKCTIKYCYPGWSAIVLVHLTLQEEAPLLVPDLLLPPTELDTELLHLLPSVTSTCLTCGNYNTFYHRYIRSPPEQIHHKRPETKFIPGNWYLIRKTWAMVMRLWWEEHAPSRTGTATRIILPGRLHCT